MSRAEMRHIKLMERTARAMPDAVLALGAEGELVVCDFYVEGIERGEEVVGGYQKGRILNVDHHAPTTRMQRRVSSTNLALSACRRVFHL